MSMSNWLEGRIEPELQELSLWPTYKLHREPSERARRGEPGLAHTVWIYAKGGRPLVSLGFSSGSLYIYQFQDVDNWTLDYIHTPLDLKRAYAALCLAVDGAMPAAGSIKYARPNKGIDYEHGK